MVTTCPLISKSSRPGTNPLVIVPRAPITICTTVTFMFNGLFNSLVEVKVLIFLFAFFFNFTLWSAGAEKSTIRQGFFFFCFVCCWLLLGLVVWLRLGDLFISQNPRRVRASHSPGHILGYYYYYLLETIWMLEIVETISMCITYGH